MQVSTRAVLRRALRLRYPGGLNRESQEREAWLALAELAYGHTGPLLALAATAGGARALLEASDGELHALGLNAHGRARLRASARKVSIAEVARRCARHGIGMVSIAEPGYPPLLREIPDPPLLLYWRGRLQTASEPAVAIVGSRKASRYGRRIADALARDLAGQRLVVVSGLALGIDAAAHEGALGAGATVAVLAGGLDRVYPARHWELFGRVIDAGCVLAEYPPATAALPRHFPVRNRIVTGLARATVVVEAGRRSGSLVSARLALEQGRELLAVPGNIDAPGSAGTNELIRDGCAPALEVEDILAAIGAPRRALLGAGEKDVNAREVVGLGNPEEAALLACIDYEPRHVDELIAAAAFDGTRVMELLTALELAGLVQQSPGGLVARVGRA